MAEYLEYDKQWHEIKEQDWPEPGGIYICLNYPDKEETWGSEMWIVSRKGDNTLKNPYMPLGLFWKIEDARIFAKAVVE